MRRETIRDWMGAPLLAGSVRDDMATVARTLVEHGIRHLPLLRQDGRVAGVVSDVDVFSTGILVDDGVWVEREPREPRELARPPATIVHPDDELALGLDAMKSAGSDYAIALSEHGMPTGILTEHDAVRAAARLLPRHFKSPARRPVHTVPPSIPVGEAIARMVDLQLRHLLVMRGGDLHSVVSIRDLMAADDSRMQVGDLLPPRVVHTMPVRSSLRQVAMEMKRLKIGSMIAMEHGEPVAIVTRSDLLTALLFLFQAEESTEPDPKPRRR